MAYRIPVYQRRVGVAGVPNFRERDDGFNPQQLVRGASEGATGIAQAFQQTRDKADAAVYQTAKTKAAELRIQYEKRLAELQGTDAIEKGATTHEELQEQLEKIGEDLPERVRKRFQADIDGEQIGFRRAVNKRVINESEKIAEDSHRSGIQSNADKARLAVKNDDAAERGKALLDHQHSVEMYIANRRMPEAVAAVYRKKAAVPVVGAMINAYIDEGRLEEASKLLGTLEDNGIDLSKFGGDATINLPNIRLAGSDIDKMKDTVENAVNELGAQELATEALNANRMPEGRGDGFHLKGALDHIEASNADPMQKKEARRAAISKYQQEDLALREQDSPTVSLLVSGMTRGSSPYFGNRKSMYDGLQPERRQIVDEKWKASLRTRRSASLQDKRDQAALDNIAFNQFKVMLMDDTAPDPNDPTESFFENVSDKMVSQMQLAHRKNQGMQKADKDLVKRRISAFALRRELASDEEDALRLAITDEVFSHVQENKGKFEPGQLRDIVENKILDWQAEREWYWYGDKRERAREDLGDDLDVFDVETPSATQTVTQIRMGRVREQLAEKQGVDPSAVPAQKVIDTYNDMLRRGLIK